MLKKVLIGLAVVIVLVGGAAGFEAYRLYNSAEGILGFHHPTGGAPCSSETVGSLAQYPQLLPWTTASAVRTATPAPLATPTGKKLKFCLDPENNDPSLNSKTRINILLLGTDNDCKFNGTILTQTDFVVTIDPVHKKVGMLSIPRDTLLPVPGVSTLGDTATYYKMDEAFSVGQQEADSTNPNAEFTSGYKYAEATVEANFGMHINYFAWVGLNGFIKVINTLGGVDINALHPILDDWYPGDESNGGCYGFSRVYIPSGPQWLDGWTALQYVRSRHSDLIGDIGRGERQLQTIVALRPKLHSLGLTNFLTVKNIVDELQGFVKSDLGIDHIGSFVSFAETLNPNRIHKLILTGKYITSEQAEETADGVEDVVNLNWAAVIPAVDKMFAPIVVERPQTHRALKFVTPAQAAAYLLRLSGATTQPATHPTQSYSGRIAGSIYFVDNGNVWRYSSSGVDQVTHTTAIDSATITSNGGELAYYRRWSENNADVWIKNLVTGRTKQITFSRDGDGNLQGGADCSEDYPLCAYVWNVSPVISPNGRTVIYASDAYKDVEYPALTVNPDCGDDGTAPSTGGGIDLALYDYDVESGTAAQATVPCFEAGGDADASFDPADPGQIVYTEYYYHGVSGYAKSRLVVLDLASQRRWRITAYRGNNMQAVWSPNGERMAWLGSSPQSTTLYEATFSHGRLRDATRRTIDTGLISEPEFSPDGKHLIYFKLVGNNFQIWIVDLRNGWPVGRPMRLLSQLKLTASSPLEWIK